MAAEKVKKTIRRPRPGTKAEAILTLTATTPATPVEIAESVNCSRAAVSQTMQRYGIKPNRLESFKKHRADILAGMQIKVIKHLNNEETLKSASTNNLAYTLSQLSNMERLERGQSTANIANNHSISESLQESIDKIIGRSVEAKQPVDNPVYNYDKSQVTDITQDNATD
jgi:hypothetical protein